MIDVTDSPLVPAVVLREKLDSLLRAGEIDGGLPIVRNKALVGLIAAPELEFALDKLENEEDAMCLMSPRSSAAGLPTDDEDGARGLSPTDFTQYIDPVCSDLFPNS
jgi:chloride channel 3/4/5